MQIPNRPEFAARRINTLGNMEFARAEQKCPTSKFCDLQQAISMESKHLDPSGVLLSLDGSIPIPRIRFSSLREVRIHHLKKDHMYSFFYSTIFLSISLRQTKQRRARPAIPLVERGPSKSRKLSRRSHFQTCRISESGLCEQLATAMSAFCFSTPLRMGKHLCAIAGAVSVDLEHGAELCRNPPSRGEHLNYAA